MASIFEVSTVCIELIELSFRYPFFLSSLGHGPRSIRSLQLRAQQRVVLHPNHVRFGNSGDVARCALCRGHYFGARTIGWCLMPKGEEAPFVRVRETFAVLHHHVNSMKFAREISSARGRIDRAIRVFSLLGKCKLLDQHRPFRKVAMLLVIEKILPLDVNVVELWKRSFTTIQTVRRNGRPHE